MLGMKSTVALVNLARITVCEEIQGALHDLSGPVGKYEKLQMLHGNIIELLNGQY